ncbi:glycosyltransferase family 2 protein [Paraconexibacter sp.]|uniref:glycosyltransferase n=1 Tax=Paraconexibacter sp. TaxID=2949640 RepID=UPI003568FEF8
MRRASIIVPARNAAATLPALLDALAALDLPAGTNVEVVLADDGSTDGTPDLARAHPLPVHVLTSPGRGPAAARNAAAAQARGDVLAFTDADCAPTPRWLAAGLAALDAGADIVQGVVAPPPGVHVGPFDRTVRVGQPTALYETANLLVRRRTFDDLGGFESWLGTGTQKELGEDAWFGWRAVRSGARPAFCAEAVVHHAVFPGTARSFVAERLRLRFFPALVRRIPELREAFCFRRWFLTSRTARFDLALAGLCGALLGRRRWPLLAALPYLRQVAGLATPWGPRRAPLVAAANVAADAVGAAALGLGSARSRTPLL